MVNPKLKDVDDILRILGDPGRFQMIQFSLLALQYFPLALNDLLPIFYSLSPAEIRCYSEEYSEGSLNLSNYASNLNFRSGRNLRLFWQVGVYLRGKTMVHRWRRM